jgi:hypothetical protein
MKNLFFALMIFALGCAQHSDQPNPHPSLPRGTAAQYRSVKNSVVFDKWTYDESNVTSKYYKYADVEKAKTDFVNVLSRNTGKGDYKRTRFARVLSWYAQDSLYDYKLNDNSEHARVALTITPRKN